MSNFIKVTEEWVLQQVKSGKPIISDEIVPTLKEKGMKRLREKLSKRGIQVWWSQAQPSDTSVIIPRNLKPDVISRDGWTVGTLVHGDNVMILPYMKS